MPRVFVVNDRNTINSLREEKIAPWVKAWSERRNVFMLDNDRMEAESSHKKLSNEEYAASMKHELSHSFFFNRSKGADKPLWLLEGVSIYTSGQTKLWLWRKPETFDSFLNYYDTGGEKLYTESGFAVELLVNTCGKEKLLNLISSLKDIQTEKTFNSKFTELYGFDLSYEEFNKLYLGR